jgi:hypothetical protein
VLGALAFIVAVFWALAALQGTPTEIAVAVIAASAIRNTEERFFIFSISSDLEGVSIREYPHIPFDWANING